MKGSPFLKHPIWTACLKVNFKQFFRNGVPRHGLDLVWRSQAAAGYLEPALAPLFHLFELSQIETEPPEIETSLIKIETDSD